MRTFETKKGLNIHSRSCNKAGEKLEDQSKEDNSLVANSGQPKQPDIINPPVVQQICGETIRMMI